MLDNLPIHSARKVIDLGCGNGVLGLSLLARDAEVEVTFIDESRMAVASAQLNVEHNLPAALPRAHFMVNNCLDDVAVGSVDGSSAIPVPPVAGDHRPYRLADVQRCPPGVASGRRTLDSRQPSSGLSQQTQAPVWQRTSRCVEQQIRYFESHQTLKRKLKETHDEKVTLAAGRSGIGR
jgi:hypothetical protein